MHPLAQVTLGRLLRLLCVFRAQNLNGGSNPGHIFALARSHTLIISDTFVNLLRSADLEAVL